VDATGPIEQLIGGMQFDTKIVDQFSRKTWSGHQILEMIQMHIDVLMGQGKEVKFLRCDNASKEANLQHFAKKGVFNWSTQPQTHHSRTAWWKER